jgi:predicted nucleic acid-binding protein
MPTTLAFVDTNVLLYAASTNPLEAAKRAAARAVLLTGNHIFSVQVAQEFFVNATAKLNPPLAADDAVKFLRELAPNGIVGLDFAIFEEAVRLRGRFQISYWDAAIIAAAQRAGATVLYSEDLSEGQAYESVRVVNPFRVGFNVGAK